MTGALCNAGLQQEQGNDFEVHTFAETTAVQFGKLSDKEIAAYIATGRSTAQLQSGCARLLFKIHLFVSPLRIATIALQLASSHENCQGFSLHNTVLLLAKCSQSLLAKHTVT